MSKIRELIDEETERIAIEKRAIQAGYDSQVERAKNSIRGYLGDVWEELEPYLHSMAISGGYPRNMTMTYEIHAGEIGLAPIIVTHWQEGPKSLPSDISIKIPSEGAGGYSIDDLGKALKKAAELFPKWHDRQVDIQANGILRKLHAAKSQIEADECLQQLMDLDPLGEATWRMSYESWERDEKRRQEMLRETDEHEAERAEHDRQVQAELEEYRQDMDVWVSECKRVHKSNTGKIRKLQDKYNAEAVKVCNLRYVILTSDVLEKPGEGLVYATEGAFSQESDKYELWHTYEIWRKGELVLSHFPKMICVEAPRYINVLDAPDDCILRRNVEKYTGGSIYEISRLAAFKSIDTDLEGLELKALPQMPYPEQILAKNGEAMKIEYDGQLAVMGAE